MSQLPVPLRAADEEERQHARSGVQGTAVDSVISKASAASLKYFNDMYVGHLTKEYVRRSPLINRGYFARVMAFKQIEHEFVQRCRNSNADRMQIISLGGGYDTAFFTLRDEGKCPWIYVEIDVREVCLMKQALLRTIPLLSDFFGPETTPRDPRILFQGGAYRLIACDLRQIDQLTPLLVAAGVDFKQPTLILSECVLIYLNPDEGDRVVEWAAQTFPNAAFCLYEQIIPNDPFGQTMVQNLRRRGCPLLSIDAHPTLQSQERRFLDRGWTRAVALNMNDVYKQFLDRREVVRTSQLEMFDEFEEWNLIQDHYALVLAAKPLLTNLAFLDRKRLLPPLGAPFA